MTTPKRRIQLQMILENILGSRNVYFEPPETIKMKYPCIVYTLDDIYSIHADNISYNNTKSYSITVISKDPDNDIAEKILELDKCSFDRRYTSDNLIHDVLTLYF